MLLSKKENSFITSTIINQQHKNPIKLDAFVNKKSKINIKNTFEK